MVEMKETANILHHATERSLILLDEVGRGTSTFDGISIAWAVAERLHDMPGRPRTLFATHYHELTDLTRAKKGSGTLTSPSRNGGAMLFFYAIWSKARPVTAMEFMWRAWPACRPAVINRAKEILAQLESGQGGRAAKLDGAAHRRPINPCKWDCSATWMIDCAMS